MYKHVIVGEGKHDLWFLHEIVTKNRMIGGNSCAVYLELRAFERDVNIEEQPQLSFINGGGSPTVKVSVRTTRPFWIRNIQMMLGVVGDTDTGSIYEKLKTYLDAFLRDEKRHPVLTPTVDFDDEEKSFILKPKADREIPVWTSEVPISLEHQVAKALKAKYKIDSSLNEDETILRAANKLNKTKEEVIRNSTILLKKEKWFEDLRKKLSNKLSL